jgi:lipid-A-disaccharide synthase-like uncharacterized protein
MFALILIGVALVWSRGAGVSKDRLRDDAWTQPIRIAQDRGVIETLADDDGSYSYRILLRDGYTSPILTTEQLRETFGETVTWDISVGSQNALFRLFNITSWWSMAWICVGIVGQMLFFARMFYQWLVSEKHGQSIVPEGFWWMSLFGGIGLFTYFVWRVDLIGVLGQSSGIVIYARNLRLIHARRTPRLPKPHNE